MSRLLLFNKPYNVLCQFTDSEGRTTLKDFITEPGVYPAGRLDRDSEGLLLLTDDGNWQQRISNPVHKLPKTYLVQVEGLISEEALNALSSGVMLNDGPTLPAKATAIAPPNVWERNPPVRARKTVPDSWLSISIVEGRNRQVRRMTAAVGFPTLRLIRMAIGEWTLDGLLPGQFRTETLPTLPARSMRYSQKPRRRR